MRKGLGMWVMSKLVMFIFLFSLVAMLSAYYMIYQDKVIDDTAKKVTQSIAETITDALAYKETTRTIWLDSNIWIRDVSRPYSLVLEWVPDSNRLVVFMTWNDQKDIGSIKSYSSASAVFITGSEDTESNFAVDHVCLYEINEDNCEEGSCNPDQIYDQMLIRPSAGDAYDRVDYLIIYKKDNKLCLAEKTVNVDLQTAIQGLKTVCGECED